MTEAHEQPHDTDPRADRGRDEGTLARRIILLVVLALVAWAGAVVLWGIPALYLPALLMVPVIWILLLLVSFG